MKTSLERYIKRLKITKIEINQNKGQREKNE